MRLAFVTPEFVTEPYFSGGLANYLGRVTAALARAGHDVHVVTRAGQHGTVDHHGVTVHRVVPLWDRKMVVDKVDRLVPRKLYNPYQDFKAAWSIARYLRRLNGRKKFDLVQVANVMAVGLFLGKHLRVPIVTRMSSYRPEWDTLAGVVPDFGVKARWKMEEWSVRGRQHVFAPTRYVAAQVEKAYGLSKVDVIESPFFEEVVDKDTTEYDLRARGKNYLLFFGRMTQMKGVQVLARALPTVLRKYPDLYAIFIGADAVAPGGGSMRDYVRTETRAFANRVQLLDPMRHSQLYPFIENASFVVLPSIVDNMPNTLLETMGHQRTAIATSGSCFEQLIEDGQSGFLIPPGDDLALAAAMAKVYELPSAVRAEMGRKARERVELLHPDRSIPILIDYYQSVVESGSHAIARMKKLEIS